MGPWKEHPPRTEMSAAESIFDRAKVAYVFHYFNAPTSPASPERNLAATPLSWLARLF